MDHKSFRLSRINFHDTYRDKYVQTGCGVFMGIYFLSLILILALVRPETWSGLGFGAFILACVLSATFYFSLSSFSRNLELRHEARERIGYVIMVIASLWCIGVSDHKGALRNAKASVYSEDQTAEQRKLSRTKWLELEEASMRSHWLLIGGAFVFLGGLRIARYSAFKRGELTDHAIHEHEGNVP